MEKAAASLLLLLSDLSELQLNGSNPAFLARQHPIFPNFQVFSYFSGNRVSPMPIFTRKSEFSSSTPRLARGIPTCAALKTVYCVTDYFSTKKREKTGFLAIFFWKSRCSLIGEPFRSFAVIYLIPRQRRSKTGFHPMWAVFRCITCPRLAAKNSERPVYHFPEYENKFLRIFETRVRNCSLATLRPI